MNDRPNKYLWSISWTQPYATSYTRPYLANMHAAVELAIEAQLARKEWPEASQIIERIKRL
jgi:hypothetical protein